MLTKTGQSNQQLPAQILGGIGEALILIYSVNILFSIFPLKLSDPIWQSQVATLLRSTSLFLLIGIALIFVCEYLNKSIKLFYFPSRRIQPLAVFAAIGFLLLIPVQCSSVYIQIRNSDNQAKLEIRQADRRISAFRAVPNLNQLRDMAKDIPPGWQYDGSVSFEDNRSRLISTSEDQLARLRIMAS